jgi:ADP-ribose pyrophosphatase YjhB (NUDIX family)
MNRHFTVSVYIVHRDKVLLHLHKKTKIMLPLGGHVEVNELPEEACVREAKEESGLNINLYNSEINKHLKNSSELTVEKILINPMHTILCEVNSEHYHIDLVYYATAKSFETVPKDGESKLFKWFTKEELKGMYNIPHNVVTMAHEALELLGER